ncbi:MAG: DUF1294 domain-containing protein [Peptococcaceae bacterium]|nr:DUF1294 domain-containing protein [Peptococcaceae bacterium]
MRNAYLFYEYIALYPVTISILAVILVIRDKRAAKKRKRRIRERTLMIVATLGGAVAMLASMLAIHHKTKHTKFMAGLPILIIIQVLLHLFVFNTSLSVNTISIITDKIEEPIKLILITDLHSCYYGKDQKQLVNAVLNEQPDIILLGGDIFDDSIQPDNTIEFIKRISGNTPCLYVSGNHEFRSQEADRFKDILISFDVQVLEGTSKDVSIRNEKIRIYGLDDPDTDRYRSRAIPYREQLRNLAEAETEAGFYTILLAHRPERTAEYRQLECDLVLCGHAHGGQWRLPLLLDNGLLSPNQGLFPKYTNGYYHREDVEMIVSRGLSRESTMAPRIFNRPELVVITLNPE